MWMRRSSSLAIEPSTLSVSAPKGDGIELDLDLVLANSSGGSCRRCRAGDAAESRWASATSSSGVSTAVVEDDRDGVTRYGDVIEV
jgi:hypothetical protein